MISFKFNWIYGLGKIMHVCGFIWVLHLAVWFVFNHFLLVDAKDESMISSDRCLI